MWGEVGPRIHTDEHGWRRATGCDDLCFIGGQTTAIGPIGTTTRGPPSYASKRDVSPCFEAPASERQSEKLCFCVCLVSRRQFLASRSVAENLLPWFGFETLMIARPTTVQSTSETGVLNSSLNISDHAPPKLSFEDRCPQTEFGIKKQKQILISVAKRRQRVAHGVSRGIRCDN